MKNNGLKDFDDNISEGEIFIQEFFEDVGIKAEFNKKLDFLKGDSKAYRVADFYLPRYDLYVEFFGLWNVSDEQKERYREKKYIYERNNIPCVYFYPENLGIIDYLFDYRAMKELKEKGKKKFLFKLRWDILRDRNQNLILKMGFCFFVLTLVLLFPFTKPLNNWVLISACTLGILIEGGSLYSEYKKLVNKKFHKERNSIS